MNVPCALGLVAMLGAASAFAEPAQYGIADHGRIWVEAGKTLPAHLTSVDAVKSDDPSHVKPTVTAAKQEMQGPWVSTATYAGGGDDSAMYIVFFTPPEAKVKTHLCSSSEGLHFTVWDGAWKASKSRRLWHGYWHLDYDIEGGGDCTDRETR